MDNPAIHEIFSLFSMDEKHSNERMLRDCLYKIPRFHRSREDLSSLPSFKVHSISQSFVGYAEYFGYRNRALNDDTPMFRYPGTVEEIVEDALIKLACANGYIDNGVVSVEFSLYELRQELKSMTKTYSIGELRTILETLHESEIIINGIYKYQKYENIRYRALEHLTLKNSSIETLKTKSSARFSRFTSTRILNGEFDDEAYNTSMRLSILSRHIYKLILRNRSSITYGIFKASSSELLHTSPVKKSTNSEMNRSLKKSFEELCAFGIITNWRLVKAEFAKGGEEVCTLTLHEAL